MAQPILGNERCGPELENKKRRLRVVLATRGRRFWAF